MTTRHTKSRQRGQALAEMGFVVLLFVVLTLGIIDFGRMLMILNVITHAARDGARAAAVVPAANWGSSQGDLIARVEQQIANVTDNDLDVTPACQVVNGSPTVSITVSGDVPFLFSFPGLWGGNIAVNRVATFRYEPLSASCPS